MNNKIIWFMWLQGYADSPDLVKRCFQSWLEHNPDYDVKFLDCENIKNFLPSRELTDLLQTREITPASFSDLVRLQLLHEYGGIWVDATTVCTSPIKSWLPDQMCSGVFMFSRPASDRHIASWFIAAECGNKLIDLWKQASVEYWRFRKQADEYFWFHYCFADLLLSNNDAFNIWASAPKISADAAHAIGRHGFSTVMKQGENPFHNGSPLFKLSHRTSFTEPRFWRRWKKPNTPLEYFLKHFKTPKRAKLSLASTQSSGSAPSDTDFGALSVSTNNLGDHVQVLALDRLLDLADIRPLKRFDRDKELDQVEERVHLVLAGWFKHGNDHWPPSEAIDPIYISFHIRPHQCARLTEPKAIAHYKKHEPIYCRDSFTANLLESYGIETATSHCFTTTFPRRSAHDKQSKVFVVSRDEDICKYMPDEYDDFQYVSHYCQSESSIENMLAATNLLEKYRKEAKIVITTLLHCALPCMAMGIPTIVCWPQNSVAGNKSDRERFSSLTTFSTVNTLEELKLGLAKPLVPDLSAIKIHLKVLLADALRLRGFHNKLSISRLVSPQCLLPPASQDISEAIKRKENRLRRMLDTGVSTDPERWGTTENYKDWWDSRAKMAVQYLDDGDSILELGTGTGDLMQMVSGKHEYIGVDLNPIKEGVLQCNVETNPLPKGSFDKIVALGILEYIVDVPALINKLKNATQSVVVSYCFSQRENSEAAAFRLQQDWINDYDELEFTNLFQQCGFIKSSSTIFQDIRFFKQKVFLFKKQEVNLNA